MEKHSEKFEEFMKCLRKTFPVAQANCIGSDPQFNPRLDPPPREWFIESFDWYIAVDLIPGTKFSYGPFYQTGGNYFWPEIGNMAGMYTEKKCFYGFDVCENQELSKEKRIEKLQKLYNNKQYNKDEHTHIYKFEIPSSHTIIDSQMYVGPVKGGDGFQANPNRFTALTIQRLIIEEKISVAKIENGCIEFKAYKSPDLKKV